MLWPMGSQHLQSCAIATAAADAADATAAYVCLVRSLHVYTVYTCKMYDFRCVCVLYK